MAEAISTVGFLRLLLVYVHEHLVVAGLSSAHREVMRGAGFEPANR